MHVICYATLVARLLHNVNAVETILKQFSYEIF
ncbi:hypothetical protein XACM_0126 [Xanthomonas euvesicatoria pv. citrumelo F1]|nr:hypothetical protein XACM_0126 [Xanthomonas euvesicatoria pv. citrumelo F1]